MITVLECLSDALKNNPNIVKLGPKSGQLSLSWNDFFQNVFLQVHQLCEGAVLNCLISETL